MTTVYVCQIKLICLKPWIDISVWRSKVFLIELTSSGLLGVSRVDKVRSVDCCVVYDHRLQRGDHSWEMEGWN